MQVQPGPEPPMRKFSNPMQEEMSSEFNNLNFENPTTAFQASNPNKIEQNLAERFQTQDIERKGSDQLDIGESRANKFDVDEFAAPEQKQSDPEESRLEFKQRLISEKGHIRINAYKVLGEIFLKYTRGEQILLPGPRPREQFDQSLGE